MSLYFDPEVPAGFQDADIEMLELAEAANDPDRRDPWTVCDWCGGEAIGTVEIYNGASNRTYPYCRADENAARLEKAHFDKVYG